MSARCLAPLDEFTAQTDAERVTLPLAHGRRLTIDAEGDASERVQIRSRSGSLEVDLRLDERGVRLVVEAIDLSLVAARSLSVTAEDIALRSRRALELDAGADMRVRVAGTRHTTVDGVDRTEAHSIETQANEGDLVIRARADVRVDAEHIGLNDDPCPAPLPWTLAASESREER